MLDKRWGTELDIGVEKIEREFDCNSAATLI